MQSMICTHDMFQVYVKLRKSLRSFFALRYVHDLKRFKLCIYVHTFFFVADVGNNKALFCSRIQVLLKNNSILNYIF